MKRTAALMLAVLGITIVVGCTRTERPEKLSKSEKLDRLKKFVADGGLREREEEIERGDFGRGELNFGRGSRRKEDPPEPPEQPIDVETAKYLGYFGKADVPKLLELLKHDNPAVRRGALQKLRREAPPPKQAIAKVIPLLNDKSSSVREAAADFLAKCGKDVQPALKDLLSLLRHHKYGVVSSAAEALKNLGDLTAPHVPELIKILEDPDCANVDAVASVLGGLGPRAKDALPALSRLMTKRWGGNSYAEAVGRIGGVDELLRAAKSSDSGVRSAAYHGMGYVKSAPKSVVSALLSATSGGNEGIRSNVAESLGRIRPTTPAIVTALSKLVSDPKTFVQRAACEALGNTEPKLDAAVTPLLAATKSKDSLVRGAATEALSKFTTSARPRILAALSLYHTDKYNAEDVINKSPKDSLPILLEVAKDPKETLQMRMNAMYAMGNYKFAKIDGGKAKQFLKKSLENENEQLELRYFAAAGLRAQYESHPKVSPTIVEALEKSTNIYVRRHAASRAGYVKYSKDLQLVNRAVTILTAALKSTDEKLVSEACDSLGELNEYSTAAIPLLCKIVADKSSKNRDDAADALGAIDPDGRQSVPVLLAAIDEKFSPSDAFEEIGQIAARVREKAGGKPKYAFDVQAVFRNARAILQNKDSYYRHYAANMFGKFGPDAAPVVPDLINLLNDKSKYVRESGIRALGEIGPKAKAALPKLQGFVRNSADESYIPAFRAMCKIGPPADEFMPVLIEGLKREDTFDAAIKAVTDYGPKAEKVLPTLSKLIENGDRDTRMKSLKAIVKFGPKAAVAMPGLRKALEDTSFGVKEVALSAIAALENKGLPALPEVKKVLQKAPSWSTQRSLAAKALISIAGDKPAELVVLVELADPDDDTDKYLEAFQKLGKQGPAVLKLALASEKTKTRENALKFLRSPLPQPDYEKLFVELLKGDNADVRRQAALKLLDWGGFRRQVAPVCAKALVTAKPNDRWRWENALERIGRPAVANLVALFLDEKADETARKQAARVLKQMGDLVSASRPKIQEGLKSKDDFIRHHTALILASTSGSTPGLHQHLLEALKSKNKDTRSSAASALSSSRFSTHADAIRPALLEAIRDTDGAVRARAASALRNYVRNEDVPALQKLYDENPNAQYAVLRALSRYRNPPSKALPLFVKALSSKQEDVPSTAADALNRFGQPGSIAILKAAADDKLPIKIRTDLLNSLYSSAKLTDAEQKVLTALLKDKDIGIRIHAAVALGRRGATNDEALALLMQGLQKDGDDFRYNCQEAISKLGDKARDLLPQLKKLMGAKEDGTRYVCCNLYATLGKEEKGTAETLISRFKTESKEYIRRTLARQLSELNEKAVPALVAVLKSSQEPTVLGALDALKNMDEKAASTAVSDIKPLLKHPNNTIAFRAACTLASIDAKTADDVLPVLQKGLNSYSTSTVNAALEALQSLGPAAAPAVPKLLELTGKKQYGYTLARVFGDIGPAAKPALPWLMRELRANRSVSTIAYSIGRIGEPAKPLVPELIAMLRNERRISSVSNALVKLAPEPATAELIRLLDDEYLKYDVIHELSKFRKHAAPAVPKLVTLLASPDPTLRSSTAYALSRLGNDAQSAVPALLKLLQSDERSDKSAAARALGQIHAKPDQVVPALIQAARAAGSDVDLQRTIVWSLASFEADAKPAVPLLVSLLDSDNEPHHVLAALGGIGPAAKPAVGKITKWLSSDDQYLQQSAIRALGGIGPEAAQAVPQILPLLKSTHKRTREAAADALWKIDPKAAEKTGAPRPEKKEAAK